MFGSVGLPHGVCFLWNPGLLWLHVISDGAIALAYFLIPMALVQIVRRRKDVPFNGVFFCFAAFIVACGLTHVMEVVTLWHPVYWVSGGLKAATAVISVATLVLLVRLSPEIVTLPGRGDLELANRRLASVLNDTMVCVYGVDRNWRIRYMNDKASLVLGARERMLDRDMREAFPNQMPETRVKLEAAMLTRDPVVFESYYQPLDLSTCVSVHPWEDGGITIFFNDISQQRRLERELERERGLRSQRIEVLARLSGELAHEIKNPLAIIHARASDLMERMAKTTADRTKPSSEEVEAACGSIVKTSDRAIRILRGVEALARDGTADPMEPASVEGIVGQAVDLVERRYRTHGVALETRMAPGLPAVECREAQIGQVLMNLLNNAFDAVDGDAGSGRWVRVQVSTHGDAESPEARVWIEVVDGGPGVDPTHRERLMETFFTTKRVGAGIGIGLSVSRSIAEDHGGSLELADVGGHTCFRLSLPVRGPASAKVAA